jgi:hypothetical protein
MSEPKVDAELLMNELLPLAKKMLGEYKEFFPYAGVLNCEGKIVHIGAKVPGEPQPKSRELIALLKHELRLRASDSKCQATALIYDVRIVPPGLSEKVDAIEVVLDHRSGFSAEVFYPYSFGEHGELKLEKSFAQRGQCESFQIKGKNE